MRTDNSTLTHRSADDVIDGSGQQPVASSTPSTAITVALVNDYELILQGLHSMLTPYADRLKVVEHEVGGTPDHVADVALFDTFAGRRDALARAADMVNEGLVQHVILYTWDAPAEFLEIARATGVSGVVLKSTTGKALVEMIERVVDGERVGLDHVGPTARHIADDVLSLREHEVLALLALGYSNPQIARELFLSVDTVKTYVRRVFTKLGVNNRTQAALLAAGHDVAAPSSRVERLNAQGAQR